MPSPSEAQGAASAAQGPLWREGGKPRKDTPAAAHRRDPARAAWWTSVLDRVDTSVYVAVGICFLVAAVVSLIYSVAAFVWEVTQPGHLSFSAVVEHGQGPQAIITLVSDLLLTLIILEVAGTIAHYLRNKATSVKPFLFIGIISGTRGILAVGARLSVSTVEGAEFQRAMVELAVNAGVIIALSIAMKLIGNYVDEDPSRSDAPEAGPPQ